MFTESLFVEHASNKELGLGKIIGDFPVMGQAENGQPVPVILAAVSWENLPQPAYQLHNPEELINVTNLFDEDEEEDAQNDQTFVEQEMIGEMGEEETTI